MRLAIPFALFLAATTAPRQGCGNGQAPAYDACAGKACGETCTACAPDDRDCMETAIVKACDPFHRCVAKVDRLCDAASAACAGKTCGAECVVDPPCRSATPPCMMPSFVGYCSGDGSDCLPAPPPCPSGPPPSWGCVGKACGDSCGYCPPGQDPATCPVPTFAPTACDAQLQCETLGAFTCSPQAACLGKSCGAACETCPACMRPYAMACDASATCVPAPVTCGP